MATKVTLRKKKGISKGRASLYLDFYPAIEHPETGAPTRREFLKMYVFEKPRSESEKRHNKEQERLAEQIRQQRENTINKPEIYSEFEKEQLKFREFGERNFVEYFWAQVKKRDNISNRHNWQSAFNYFEKFTGGTVKFSELNETLIEEFKNYLLDSKMMRSKKFKLSRNSAHSYFNKLKATLRQAYKEGLLKIDLNSRIKPIKEEETMREFLTMEELNQLAKTPCPDELLKRIALFSALTGLRFSDIKKLTWNEIIHIEGLGYYLRFTQQKTKGVEMLPISEQAFNQCGQRGELNERVFIGVQYSSYYKMRIERWTKAAGITKHITFHCFRHTFATLQLYNGTEMYSVSKMLGHKDLKTTQAYAKIVDSTLRAAADKIVLDL
jgi:integrase